MGDITVSILCFGKLTCKEVYSWRRFKTATAAGTHRTTEQLAPRSLRDPRRLRGDAAAEESAEPEIVPRQLKAGRSYGKEDAFKKRSCETGRKDGRAEPAAENGETTHAAGIGAQLQWTKKHVVAELSWSSAYWEGWPGGPNLWHGAARPA